MLAHEINTLCTDIWFSNPHTSILRFPTLISGRSGLWQAKHDKSGLSWKSPIESRWSMCEIEKSLCEIGKSIREIRLNGCMTNWNCYTRMKKCHARSKLPVENEKLPCEICINCRQWKIVWEKEITIWHYQLVFSEPLRRNQSAESILSHPQNGRATECR